MPAKSDLTSAQLAEYLNNEFGSAINADHVKSAAKHFGVKYATATNPTANLQDQYGSNTWLQNFGRY